MTLAFLSAIYSIPTAFETFNTMEKLAPVAENMNG